MTAPMLEKLVRFQHPDRTLNYARSLTDATRAALFGTDEGALHAAVEHLDGQRAAAAHELAADPQVTADLTRVPFRPGQRLVAIGESATADRLSWFEILRTLLHCERCGNHVDEPGRRRADSGAAEPGGPRHRDRRRCDGTGRLPRRRPAPEHRRPQGHCRSSTRGAQHRSRPNRPPDLAIRT
jgi:hypothetical protein